MTIGPELAVKIDDVKPLQDVTAVPGEDVFQTGRCQRGETAGRWSELFAQRAGPRMEGVAVALLLLADRRKVLDLCENRELPGWATGRAELARLQASSLKAGGMRMSATAASGGCSVVARDVRGTQGDPWYRPSTANAGPQVFTFRETPRFVLPAFAIQASEAPEDKMIVSRWFVPGQEQCVIHVTTGSWFASSKLHEVRRLL